MIPWPTLLLFFGASVALTVAPGPDNLFVVAQGISRGRRVATITAWGMCSGITIHTVAAALGISAVFHSSPMAFEAVKFTGAAYLAYLAFRAARAGDATVEAAAADPLPAIAHFRRGLLMNVLNPKVALFFLAFLPQFTTEERGGIWLQMTLLGMLFMAQGFVIFTAIAWFSGTLGDRLTRQPRLTKHLSWFSACVLLALAVRISLAHK